METDACETQQRKKWHSVWIELQFFPSNFPLWNYRVKVSYQARHWAGAPIELLIWFAYTIPQATRHSHLGRKIGKEGGIHPA